MHLYRESVFLELTLLNLNHSDEMEVRRLFPLEAQSRLGDSDPFIKLDLMKEMNEDSYRTIFVVIVICFTAKYFS